MITAQFSFLPQFIKQISQRIDYTNSISFVHQRAANTNKELSVPLLYFPCLPPVFAAALVITLLSFTFLTSPFLFVSQDFWIQSGQNCIHDLYLTTSLSSEGEHNLVIVFFIFFLNVEVC